MKCECNYSNLGIRNWEIGCYQLECLNCGRIYERKSLEENYKFLKFAEWINPIFQEEIKQKFDDLMNRLNKHHQDILKELGMK